MDPRKWEGYSFFPGNGLFQSGPLGKPVPSWRSGSRQALAPQVFRGREELQLKGTWGSPHRIHLYIQGD